MIETFEIPSLPGAVTLSGPQQAEEIANDPRVYPFVAFNEGPIEVADSARIYDGIGCSFVFQQQQPGIWHLHTLSLPEARGRNLLLAAKAAARSLFSETDCQHLFTISPKDNPASRPPKSFGFRHLFDRLEWNSRFGTSVGADFYALDIMDWIVRDKEFRCLGEWFHASIETAKAASGATVPPHTDDVVHDHFVGAVIACANCGRPEKAVGLYNTWAGFAGYHPIIREGIDMYFTGDALLRLSNGRMEVIECL